MATDRTDENEDSQLFQPKSMWKRIAVQEKDKQKATKKQWGKLAHGAQHIKNETLVIEMLQPHLAAALQWSSEVEALFLGEILSIKQIRNIRHQPLCDRPNQLLVELCQCEQSFIEKVIAALNLQDARHLARRLEAEMQAQRDELRVCSPVEEEAGQVVHSEHGHDRRMSEYDKRRLQKLLAHRLQCTRQSMEMHVQELEGAMERSFSAGRMRDELMNELLELTQRYIADLRDHVREPSVDMMTTREHRQALEAASGPPLGWLQETIYLYLRMASQAMWECQRLEDETQRTWQVLGKLAPRVLRDKGKGRCIGVGQPVGALTLSVRRALQVPRDALRQQQEKANQRQQAATGLKGDLTVEKWKGSTTSDVKQYQLEQCQQQYRLVQMELNHLQEDMDAMRSELKQAEEEQENWRRRCELLERSTQLANIYSRKKARPCSSCTYRRHKAIDSNTQL